MSAERPPFPVELWEVNYDYPSELFEDLPADRKAAKEEKVARMARYAVAEALELRCEPERLIKIAMPEKNSSFITVIRKIRLSYRYGEIAKSDIEIKAEELGVFEYIWPLNQKRLQKAAEDERRIEDLRAAEPITA